MPDGHPPISTIFRTGRLLAPSMPVSSSALPASLLIGARLYRPSREALLAIFERNGQSGLPGYAPGRELNLVLGTVRINIA